MRNSSRLALAALCVTLLSSTAMIEVASAQAPAAPVQQAITIPAQELGAALVTLGRQTGRNVLFAPDLVAGKRSTGVAGAQSFEQALTRMLEGTGLSFSIGANGAATLAPRAAQLAPPAPVRTARAPEEPPEEVVVTGTRIRGTAPVGSELIALNREQIELTGRMLTADVVRTLPQNTGLGVDQEVRFGQGNLSNYASGSTANLRGLGTSSTLSLLNGHRIAPSGQGAFVDISQIPLSAIERIEVVVDGASAIYGSDAIGGVVNFILRKNYEGADATAAVDLADGFRRYSANGTIGHAWSSGRALLSYEYFRQTPLDAGKRDYYTDDLRRFGGNDLRLTASSPGNISANGTTYAIPRGQNGVGLTAASLVAGTVNYQDEQAGTTILPGQRRNSFVTSLSQDLSDRVRVFADGLYSVRTSDARNSAQVTTLSVPSTNPFFVSPVPGATRTSVAYSFLQDVGAARYVARAKDHSWTVGTTADLFADWHLTASMSGSADRAASNYVNRINTALLAAALADPNPATAFNPFADGSANNPATLQRVLGYYRTTFNYGIRSEGFDADGSLFALPGGRVRLALGAEHRTERYGSTSASYGGAAPVFSATSLHRRVAAGFGEFLIPIAGKDFQLPAVQALDLSLAARGERYSDFGTTANPKLGLRWVPVSDLTIRGNWGRSFKAPLLTQTDGSSGGSASQALPDPSRPGQTQNFVFTSGGNSSLGPETASTWSIGADFTPSFVPGLTLGGSYFSTDFSNRIQAITATDLNQLLAAGGTNSVVLVRNPNAAQLAAIYNSPLWNSGAVQYPAGQVGAILDIRYQNLATVKQRGFDFLASYVLATRYGSLTFTANATLMTAYEVALFPGAATVDQLGMSGAPVRFRMRTGAQWSRDGYNASLFVNRVGSYTNTTTVPGTKVDPWTTVDGQVSYKASDRDGWMSGLSVAVSVQNLFDAAPPFVNNLSNRVGYDPEQANALGRIVSLSIRKSW